MTNSVTGGPEAYESQRSKAWPVRAAWMAAAALLALAIFIVDAFSPFGIAIAVLYVVVVLLANQFANRRGLLLIAAGCMGLAVAGFLVDHGNERVSEATFRCLISLAAIVITTALLVRGQKIREALEESEARYRMFLNVSAVSFWCLDVSRVNEMLREVRAQGVNDLRDYVERNPEFVSKAMEATTIVDVNEKGLEMFGARKRDDLVGRSVRDGWPGKNDIYFRCLETSFRREPGFQAEIRVPTLDGREFDALFCMAAPPEIRARGMALVAHIDISEQVEARTTVARMQADLAHAARLSMLGEFTASIAHEINQPLAAIATNGEAGQRWLARTEPDVGEAQTLMGRIVGDARRAADIIKRIRNMASKQTLARTSQAINPVIDESVMFVRHELHAHDVVIRLDLAPDLPDILMDRVQIQQVLSNLIVNAVQAMLEHGVARPRITITSRMAADQHISVSVADNGPGIMPDDMERLFDSFFTTKSGGMGLGLPISRSIIEAHSGSITVNGQSAGGGACFTILLPQAATPAIALGRH